MRRVLFLLVLITGCGIPPLEPGLWTGTLAPERHPEQTTELSYAVSYPEVDRETHLILHIVDPNGVGIPTRASRLDGDTLRFAFNEPEAGQSLTCALGRDGEGFAGRCTDARGRGAWFTMEPPEWYPFGDYPPRPR